MRNYTRSTGNKEFDYYTRYNDEVIQIPTIIKPETTPGLFFVRSGRKIYMAANPEIEANMTIGIQAFPFQGRGVPLLSQLYPVPKPGSNTAAGIGVDTRILVTFCDCNGVELFKRVPLPDLYPQLRKVKAYTGKISTFRSYFEISPGGFNADGNAIVVNLAFYLRK